MNIAFYKIERRIVPLLFCENGKVIMQETNKVIVPNKILSKIMSRLRVEKYRRWHYHLFFYSLREKKAINKNKAILKTFFELIKNEFFKAKK